MQAVMVKNFILPQHLRILQVREHNWVHHFCTPVDYTQTPSFVFFQCMNKQKKHVVFETQTSPNKPTQKHMLLNNQRDRIAGCLSELFIKYPHQN